MEHPAITWIGWMAALLFLAPSALSWWRTNQLFGGINCVMVRQMLHLCLFTGHSRILGLSVVAISSLVGIRLFGVPIPLGIMAAMVSTALVPFLKLATPPAVLFLAGSSDRATELFYQLQLSLSPLRVVALLDPHRMGHLGQMLRLDLMRTSSEETWKSMVHRLLDIAPVYVADTVHRTSPVRYEAFLLLAPERAARTVFICNDDGKCPSLLAEGIDPSEHAISVIPAGDMGVAVLRVLDLSRALHKRDYTPSQRVSPVIPENWESLPSMLMVCLADGLDGEFLISQARNTDKELVAFLTPLSSLGQDAAKLSIELSWDFSRNPRLVGLYLQSTGLAMVRRDFLLQNAALLHVHVSGLRAGAIKLEDLLKPEPVGVALQELCVKWKIAAAQRGLEFRFARK
jgi:hypothetical protein